MSSAIKSEGAKFAALLPHTDAIVAVEIAELMRQQVKAKGIAHDQSKVGGFPSQFVTVSIGVASTTPNAQSDPEMLIAAAESALLQSKRKGRDRVTLLLTFSPMLKHGDSHCPTAARRDTELH